MGFEYKIIATLNQKQISDIKALLEVNKEFEKKREFDNQLFWDFRFSNNTGKMPNISISFENDGIYLCRYSGGHLWEHLEELKKYIIFENISYEILDYQE